MERLERRIFERHKRLFQFDGVKKESERNKVKHTRTSSAAKRSLDRPFFGQGRSWEGEAHSLDLRTVYTKLMRN